MPKMPVNLPRANNPRRVYLPPWVPNCGFWPRNFRKYGQVYVFLDTQKFYVRGIEISANHLKSIAEGFVFARASFIHKGRTTQLCEIKITDEANNLISMVKLTTIALPKKK